MKKRIPTRVLSAFLAGIMVFLMIPFSAITVFAEDNTTSSIDSIEKYRLDIINGISNEGLVSYVNTQFDKMNIESGVDTGKSTIQTVLGTTAKYSKIISASCKILNLIPYVNVVSKPVGEVVGSIGEISGEFVEDNSTDILMAQLKEMQDELGEQLENLSGQISDLSAEQRANITTLAEYLVNYEDLKDYKAILLEFSSQSDGNDRFGTYKDYYTWKSELYISFNALLDAIDKDVEDLQPYYDKLYMVASESSVLYSYLTDTGAFGDTSIQEIMYRYYILSKHNEEGIYSDLDFQLCIEECIEYSEDWYSTYELSQMCLNICYTYQLQELIEKYGAENLGASTTYYVYNDIANQVNYKGVIYPFLIDPQKNLDVVTAEMAEYYARILNLDESYIYENVDEKLIFNVQYQEILSETSYNAFPYSYGLSDTCYIRTNNTVNSGDTLYLNVMPEIFEDIFNASLFTFTTNNENVTITRSGVVDISDDISMGDTFCITMLYDGSLVYSLDFVIGGKYSGGVGSKTCPYLIATPEDLILLGESSSDWRQDVYFWIANNIDMSNHTGFLPIGTNAIPFEGIFDGNGYTISNLVYDGDARYAGVFGVIGERGRVKDLYIDNSSFYDHTTGSSNRESYAGAIAGINRGTISGCHISNTNITAYGYLYNDFIYGKAYAGGIAGKNYGTISFCQFNSGTIYSNSYMHFYDSGHDHDSDGANKNYSICGGISGYSNGNITDCLVAKEAILKSYAYSECAHAMKTRSPYIDVWVGGLVGHIDGGTVERVYSMATISQADYGRANTADTGGSNTDNCIISKGTLFGHRDSQQSGSWFENKIEFVYVAHSNLFILNGETGGGSYDLSIFELENKFTFTIVDSYADSNIVNTLTNAGWVYDESIGYPTLPQKTPIVANSSTINENDKTNYIRGETHYKYIDEYGNVINYPLSAYRIDTSIVGSSEVINLEAIEGTTMYVKAVIDITVIEEKATELVVFAEPIKKTYALQDDMLDLDGLILITIYDNGTAKVLDNGSARTYTSDFDFTHVGETTITFVYDGVSALVNVNVVCYHENTIAVEEEKPTCTSIGYSEGTYCNDCKTYIDGHEEIPSLSTHPYGDWINFSNSQHSRTCACGEVEYATHNWNGGTVTKPATHLAAGELTKICSECGATKIETIEPITNHSFGIWKLHDKNQHIRTCECGEKEYANHAWNDGVITTYPTHLAGGEKTYTCIECTATKIEEISPIEGHAFNKWTKHDDMQHVRTCECGETEYADHTWDDGTITTPATYEQEGVKTYACLDCEATYTVAIPKPVSVHLFVVDDASAVPGGTMQVNVRLENNPGIAMMRLKISYDSSMLTLDQVTYNTEIGGTATQPTISDGYVTLLWYNDSENVEGDWIFATLSFTVKETATVGSVSDIVLTYDAEEVCDIEENNVVFSIDNGSATVLDHVPGDINGDDGLTSKDLLRLARYFAGWDVEVNELALDINGDGTVNSKDLLRLARYLAGWDVEIH